MWELFKAELLRFRVWGIAAAVVHMLLLGFSARLVDLAQQPLGVYRGLAAVYALLGLLLGLYQMAGYRRPNAWLNLLHRPLPAWRIGGALLAAGALWLLLALLLPGLLLAVLQDSLTARVVDVRHLLLPLAGAQIALCGYAAGAYAMLGRRRYSLFALVLLALPLTSGASGAAALLVQLLVLGWLLALLAVAFRADLESPPRRALANGLTALPVQAGLYVALLLGAEFGIQLAWIMLGTHPLNAPTPLPGGVVEASRANGRELLLAVLDNSRAEQTALWREQIPLSDVDGLAPRLTALPRRHELTNRRPMSFVDDKARIQWTFSHDSMRFHGMRIADGQPAGTLAIAGDDDGRLPVPPLPGDSTRVVVGNTLYRYNADRQLLMPWARLPPTEQIASAREIGQHLVLLGDQALYLFDRRRDDGIAELQSPQRVPLPDAIGNLGSVDLLELMDGWLISFSYLRWAHADDVAPFQQLLHVDAQGNIETIARRELLNDYPDLFRWRGWWLSPAMHAVREAAEDLFAESSPLQAKNPPPIPRQVQVVAAMLMLLSLLAAAWITRDGSLSRPARLVWLAACAVIGLPALLSLWLIHPPQARMVTRGVDRMAAAGG